MDAVVADNGLSREGFALRLPQQINRRHERYDKDGLVDRYRLGASSHGNSWHARQAGYCSSGPEVKKYPCED